MKKSLVGIAAAGMLYASSAAGYVTSQAENEALCGDTWRRMASAQSSRLLKAVSKCVKNNPSTYGAVCVPYVDSNGNLTADDPRLASRLIGVEEHGDDKLPRNCKGLVQTQNDPDLPDSVALDPDFFEPACYGITDTEAQLRRCVYNENTLPFIDGLVSKIGSFAGGDGACGYAIARQARLRWRDTLKEDVEPQWEQKKYDRAVRRISRKCGEEGVESFVTDLRDDVDLSTAPMRQVPLD